MAGALPGLEIDPGAVEFYADRLRGLGQQARDLAVTVNARWRELGTPYRAPETTGPEGERVLGCLDRSVVRWTTDTMTATDKVARALETLATEAELVSGRYQSAAEGSDPGSPEEARWLHRLAQVDLECANAIRAAIGLNGVDVGAAPGPRTDPGADPSGGADSVKGLWDLITSVSPIDVPDLPLDPVFVDGEPLPVPTDESRVRTQDGHRPLPEPLVQDHASVSGEHPAR